jgi:hypothetical protein
LSLWIAGQCRVYRPRADLARVLLALAPLLGAALIAISRCEDYRHDVYDVSVGSVLGMAVAHYTYRRYYPALRSRGCAEPYPNPMDEMGKGWKKVEDEEVARGAGDFELEEFSGEDEDGEGEQRGLKPTFTSYKHSLERQHLNVRRSKPIGMSATLPSEASFLGLPAELRAMI